MKKRTFIKIKAEGDIGYMGIDQIKAFGKIDGEFKLVISEDGSDVSVDEKTYNKIISLFNIIDLTEDGFLSETDVEM